MADTSTIDKMKAARGSAPIYSKRRMRDRYENLKQVFGSSFDRTWYVRLCGQKNWSLAQKNVLRTHVSCNGRYRVAHAQIL